MKNLLLATAFALAFTFTPLFTQTQFWELDKVHTHIGFSVRHMMVATVRGKFKDYSADVKSDKPDFSDLKLDVKIITGSIDTDNEKRDGHLKSADFFDAANNPEIRFVSKSVKSAGKGKLKITGDFTLRGVTKTITLLATVHGSIKDPWGNTKAGFTLSGEINRMDYGAKWNTAIETGGVVVGEMVKLEIEVEVQKAK